MNDKVMPGHNCIDDLSHILQSYHKILVFCGKKSFTSTGLKERVDKLLAGKQVTYYSDFSNNPKEREMVAALAILEDRHFDAIIAIGGGSVMDFAKTFRICFDTSLNVRELLAVPPWSFQKHTHLIAIPPTAGTGAEATHFAVIYVVGVKQSVEHLRVLPDCCIVDSSLLPSLPRYQKACTAMDAFCQALESFWSVHATAESKTYSLAAASICKKHIIPYVNEASDNDCDAMSEASHMAGKAINIAKTTISHALSYYISSAYSLPHGHAVSLSIARLFLFNLRAGVIDNTLMQALALNANDIIPYFTDLCTAIDIETSLKALNIINIGDIVAHVNCNRLKNNPAILSSSDLISLFNP
jgi:alcohol dehydrogenase class IV